MFYELLLISQHVNQSETIIARYARFERDGARTNTSKLEADTFWQELASRKVCVFGAQRPQGSCFEWCQWTTSTAISLLHCLVRIETVSSDLADEGLKTNIRSKDVHVWFCHDAEIHPWNLSKNIFKGTSSSVVDQLQLPQKEAMKGGRTDGV
jgi:hypothetical protein